MKIISWNIRGSHGPQKRRLLKRKISMEKPAIIFLQETKSTADEISQLGPQIWRGCSVAAVDAQGASGGLAILWDSNQVRLSNFLSTRRAISADFLVIGARGTGHLTNVYGPTAPGEKLDFLNSLEWFNHQNPAKPWLIGGDFNMIKSPSEKRGGRATLDPGQQIFTSFINRCGLVDVETVNGWYTWNNRRTGGHSIASRLDRFLVSENYFINSGDINASVLPAAGSDHWPVCLKWGLDERSRRRPFRFESFWLTHPDLRSLISSWWKDSEDPSDRSMYSFQQRLKSLKVKLKDWNREHFGNIFQEKARLERRLEEIQKRGMQEEFSEELAKEEEDILNSIAQRETQEEIFWKEKSRNRWLQEGERNTKFFHRATIQHRNQNRILSLKNDEGRVLEDHKEIEGELCTYFQEVLSEPIGDRNESISRITQNIPQLITPDINKLLIRPVEMSEVEEAVNQMAEGTAPGPDGFTVTFFHKFWDLLKGEILHLVESSRKARKVLSAFNATFITLLPKSEGANHPSKFRPISLCNVVYKIITKVIANRIKPFMNILIAPEQSGFVEGRQILDGIILIHEVVHSLKHSHIPGMLVKLDLSKAYDKLNWDFMKAMLRAYGFCEDWIEWVMNLTSSAFFSILINGSPSQPFNPSRGIRQGDPLSPYLFILMAEGLGRTIRAFHQNQAIRGIKLFQDLEAQTHQQFVDDTMLMGHASVQEAKAIKAVLHLFSQASGLDINVDKSQIFFFNTPGITKRNILRILGFQGSSLPSKYLGAPLSESTLKKVSWQELLEKIRQKLASWTFRSLNLASRLILVKSVLQSMPTYLFSVLGAPKGILKEIRALQRTFLWGKNQEKPKWSLVSWEKLCLPKGQGGLGLRDPDILGSALRAKTWWRWVSNGDTPWARLWHRKYAPTWSPDNLVRFNEKPRGSQIWNAAVEGQKLIQDHAFWEIYQGDRAEFWKDSWNQWPAIQSEVDLPETRAMCTARQLVLVRDFWEIGRGNEEYRLWQKEDWWRNLGDEEDWKSVQDLLSDRQIRTREGHDRLRWGHLPKGTFSVKEAYGIIAGWSNQQQQKEWSRLWEAKLWPKISIFLWLVCKKRILTWDNLKKRGMQGPSWCVMCGKEEETMCHLLDGCDFASALWDTGAQLFRRSDRRRGTPDISVQQWGREPFSNSILNSLWSAFPGFLLWNVWKERNRRIFDHKFNSRDAVWGRIRRLMIESLKLYSWGDQDLQAPPAERMLLHNWGITTLPVSLKPIRNSQPGCSSPDFWTPPKEGLLKFNFDGASKGNPGCAGFGGIFRNALGQAIWVLHGFIGQDTNNSAELEGLLHGLQLAKEKGWFPLIIEGDSRIILRMAIKIQAGKPATKVAKSWRLEGRLERLGEMLKSSEACTWSHIRRNGNKVADRLANLGVEAKAPFWHGPLGNLPIGEAQATCRRLIEKDRGNPDAGVLHDHQ